MFPWLRLSIVVLHISTFPIHKSRLCALGRFWRNSDGPARSHKTITLLKAPIQTSANLTEETTTGVFPQKQEFHFSSHSFRCFFSWFMVLFVMCLLALWKIKAKKDNLRSCFFHYKNLKDFFRLSTYFSCQY